MELNYAGIIVGATVFLSIGICHPITIRLEYYLGRKGWWVFCVAGIACTIISLMVESQVASTIIAALAFSCFWGIGEVIKQEQRVLKGWFPENPKRHDYYEQKRKELSQQK